MRKISLFIGTAIALLTLASSVSATKLVSTNIVDKDYIMLFFKDGDVVYHEGPRTISGCDLNTACATSAINDLVRYGTAMGTANAVVASNWKITSTDDPDFGGEGIAPSNVYRKSKLTGMAQKSWNSSLGDYNFDWAYEHTLFLRLPQSMESGKSYTIHIPANINSDVTAQTITFDIFNHRSEAVKVNVVGYSTADNIKSADVYIWMGNGGSRDYSSFVGNKVYIYNIDTEESHEVGELSLWKTSAGETRHNHQMLRTNVWNVDFTGFYSAGNYRLVVEDIGCSDNFTISDNIYFEPFKVSTQGFYYMRIGETDESVTPVTRRPLYIPGVSPVNCKVNITTAHPYNSAWSDLGGGDRWDEPGSKSRETDSRWNKYSTGRTNPNAWGGHSDALDWDRHLGHVSIIYDLLLPYFITNGGLPEDNLGITESGNGIPDIIDEARNEVDFWLRLRDGMGYSHGLTNPTNSATSPVLFQAGNTGVAAWANAANAAMLADCFRILWEKTGLQEHKDLMEEYRDSAIVAYTYVSNLSTTDQMLTRAQEVGCSTMSGKDFRITAAAFLYNLTGNTDYEKDLLAYSRCTTAVTSISNESNYNELYAIAGYLFSNREINYPDLYENMKRAIIAEAKSKETNYSNSRPTRRSTDHDNGWFVAVIHNQRSIIAHAISEEGSDDRKLFENALILEADFSLGRNPMSRIHMTTATTGLGDKRSIENGFTSGWNDGIPGVHPGHTIYMNQYDWGGGPVRGCPTWMTSKNYPGVGSWPYGELYYNIRYVWASNEFTPQQTMRGKQALYGYLYAIRPNNSLLPSDPAEQVATPIASVPSGSTVNKNTTVALSSNTVSATVYYTLDGSEPSATNGFKYSEPVIITDDVTINAIAIKVGMLDSEIAVFEYTVSETNIQEQVATPVASVFSGLTINKNKPVMLSNHTPDATIYYTLDGSTPSAASTKYTAQIVVTKTVTISAIAIKAGMIDSEIVIFEYTVCKHSQPEANISGLTEINKNSSVILSTDDDGTIYYTLDGSTPSATNGFEYTQPIIIEEDVTIKAIVISENCLDSEVAVFEYTVCKHSQPETNISGLTEINKNSSVILSTDDDGTIYYTLDGSTPSATNGFEYTQPLIIEEDVTIKAIVISENCLDSELAVFAYTVCKHAKPVTDIAGLTGLTVINKNTSVTLSTTNGTIYYTLDGSTPSATNGLVYTQPVVIAEDVTIKAIVISESCLDSEVAVFAYTVCRHAKPEAEPVSSEDVEYETPVTLSAAGGTIYYTLDESAPLKSPEFEYTQPIVLTEDVTIYAIAASESCLDSEVAIFEYTVLPAVEPVKCLNFDSYAVTKWNNTFMLNLQKLKAEGYDVTACKWYKNDKPIGEGFTYSAGEKKTDILEAGAVYSFELKTSNQSTVCSTEKRFALRNANVFVYPNPVSTGGTLYVETSEAGVPIEIYSQNGTIVKHLLSTGELTTVTLDIPAGNYIVKTNTEEIKIIVK